MQILLDEMKSKNQIIRYFKGVDCLSQRTNYLLNIIVIIHSK